MAPPEELQRYMAGLTYRKQSNGGGDDSPHPFVTISRQAGAGGRSLAQAVVREFGEKYADDPSLRHWEAFDRELCEKVANDPKLRVSLESLLSEHYRTEIEDYLHVTMARDTPQYAVIKRLFQTIRSLAACGNAVIVGRAGCCVTRGWPGGVHIRLVASEESRLTRMKELLHADAKEAKRIMEDHDASRARLVRRYFGRNIDDPLLYHAIFNTDELPIPQIAALVAQMAKEKTARPMQAASQE